MSEISQDSDLIHLSNFSFSGLVFLSFGRWLGFGALFLQDDPECRGFEALLSEGNSFVASAEFLGVARAEQEARNMAKLLIGSLASFFSIFFMHFIPFISYLVNFLFT